MRRLSAILVVSVVFICAVLVGGGFTADSQDAKAKAKEELQGTFKNLPIESFEESVIPGLYEVVAGTQVFYFSPNGYLIFGEIWSKDGKSITAEKRSSIEAKKVRSIPADKALRIGKGPKKVIEFSDPDCPYCRRAEEFFSKRDDVTRYVFFVPLRQIHPNAEKKALYILCSKDPEKAYHDAYSGKLDKEDLKIDQACESLAKSKLAEMESIGASLSVTGTPQFYIGGEKIVGANLQLIEEKLKALQ